jgi:lipoprotein-anchoring transpeptidase ErfK/SrfK
MSWTYRITDGAVTDSAGERRFVGYSGRGHSLAEGRNNPDMIKVIAVGPIPPGLYAIGSPHTSAQTGPYTMDLDPLAGTQTFGRAAFRIHGNNAANDASHGCIILPPDARHAIWESGDHQLEVVI